MASTLNEHSLEKKLMSVNNTQDSIQTLSLWILHHKAHHQKIVDVWFNVLKKVKMQQRLTLFYVANDVIQHSKRKGLNVYLDSFSEVLKEATTTVRDDSIKNSVARIFKIWDERSIYQSDFITELQSTVIKSHTATPKEPDNIKTNQIKAQEKMLAEFKPQKVFDSVLCFRTFENEVELKRRQLNTLRLDASSTEALKHLKDRAHGNKFSREFGEATAKLDDYVKCQEKEIADRHCLLELLDQAQLFYSHQYGEAKIVANAYKNFGNRINNLKKKLDELKKTLPDPTSPIPSPSMDAPSPGSTPPDDLLRDNTEAIDMELSDDDEPIGNIVAAEPLKPPLINATKPISETVASIASSTVSSNTSIPFLKPDVESPKMEPYSPSSMDSAPSPEGSPIGLNLSPVASPSSESNGIQIPALSSQPITSSSPQKNSSTSSSPPPAPIKTADNGASSLDSRLSSLLQNISSMPLGLQNSFLGDMNPPHAQNPVFTPTKQAFDIAAPSTNAAFIQQTSVITPEGAGSTPLKDEGNTTPLQDEDVDQPTENPIEFLTRIISKSHGGQSGLEFLENLSSLTNKVKMNLENEKNKQTDDKETPNDYPELSNSPELDTKNTYPSTNIPDSPPVSFADSWSHNSSKNTPTVTSQYSPLWSSPQNSESSQTTSLVQGNSLPIATTINSGQLISSTNSSTLPPRNSEPNCGPPTTTPTSLSSIISSLSASPSSSSLSTILSVINSNHSSTTTSALNQNPHMSIPISCPPPVPPPNIISSQIPHQFSPIRPLTLPKPILKNTFSRPPFPPRIIPIDMDFRQPMPPNQTSNIVTLTSTTNCDRPLDSNADQNANRLWSSFNSNKNDEASFEVREPQPPSYHPPALLLRNISGQEVSTNQNEFLQKLKEKTSQSFPANFPQVNTFKKQDPLPPPPPPPPPAPILNLQAVLSNLKTLVPYNNNSDQDSDKSSEEEESSPVPPVTNLVSNSDERQLNDQNVVEEKNTVSGPDTLDMPSGQKIETTLEQRMKRDQFLHRNKQNDPNIRERWPSDDRSWGNSRHPEAPFNKQSRFDKNYDQGRQYDYYDRNAYPRRDHYPREPQPRHPYYPRNDNHNRSPVKRHYPYPPHY